MIHECSFGSWPMQKLPMRNLVIRYGIHKWDGQCGACELRYPSVNWDAQVDGHPSVPCTAYHFPFGISGDLFKQQATLMSLWLEVLDDTKVLGPVPTTLGEVRILGTHTLTGHTLTHKLAFQISANYNGHSKHFHCDVRSKGPNGTRQCWFFRKWREEVQDTAARCQSVIA